MDLGTMQKSEASREEIEHEMVITESDLRKVLLEVSVLEDDIRRLKKEEARDRIEREEKEETLRKKKGEKDMMEEELKQLKKKLNITMAQ